MWVHILIVTILCVKWVNLVQKKWLRNTKSQSQQLRYRSGLGSILVLHSGDLSSRRDIFPPLPDISLANTHYLTWLWVCMCQPSQQSSNHIKVHTPRRCQIIAAPFFFFFYLLVLMTCDSCSRGYFSKLFPSYTCVCCLKKSSDLPQILIWTEEGFFFVWCGRSKG